MDKHKSHEIWCLVLIILAAVLGTFMVFLISLCYHRNRKHKGGKRSGKFSGDGYVGMSERKLNSPGSINDPERTKELDIFDEETPVFDLDDLLRASAEQIGRGKVGITYTATLESGSVVAVKILKDTDALGKKEFIKQIQLLAKMRHENLVEIISFFYSKQQKLVIYEFVPHGSLFELLHENRGVGRTPLNWATRLSMVKDIAMGLTYLHQSLSSHKVPHANLKSTNILIYQSNQSYHCKLTDYGFLPLLRSQKSSEMLAIGRSPEFLNSKKLTHKADVYCFGLVLLELITGRKPVLPQIENIINDLSAWVRSVVNTDWSTDILDMEILASKDGHDEMFMLAEIALECTDMVPERRPEMSEVLRRIEEIETESDKGKLSEEPS